MTDSPRAQINTHASTARRRAPSSSGRIVTAEEGACAEADRSGSKHRLTREMPLLVMHALFTFETLLAIDKRRRIEIQPSTPLSGVGRSAFHAGRTRTDRYRSNSPPPKVGLIGALLYRFERRDGEELVFTAPSKKKIRGKNTTVNELANVGTDRYRTVSSSLFRRHFPARGFPNCVTSRSFSDIDRADASINKRSRYFRVAQSNATKADDIEIFTGIDSPMRTTGS